MFGAAAVTIVAVLGGVVGAVATLVRLWWELRDRRRKAEDPREQVPELIRVVHRGSHGKAVDVVQARLRERGWNVAVDGIFGPHTEHVVRQFQAEKGLPVDGIVGPATWAALWTASIT